MDQELIKLSGRVGSLLAERALTISTAESCTGGLLSHTLTAISGSSTYFMGGVVAYSNQIKEDLLGVQRQTLDTQGAVSQQTAHEMAAGVRMRFKTQIGLSTTGIAGPTGATATKPVGLVYLGISMAETTRTYACQFSGDRLQVIHSSVVEILSRLLDLLYAGE